MLGARESTLLFACCVTRRAFDTVARRSSYCARSCVLLVFPGDADAVCESARYPLGY